ncbi:LLM class flavin-dependent oxidoreductase, partial [Micromonospora sp. CPCC 205371]|nr:LLM class flavin-dependent oxidoreductase [Micromonospora sp. CPCC 205371]
AADGASPASRGGAAGPPPAAGLPVWVAATSASTVDVAAARGLPLLLGVHDEPGPLLDRYGPSGAEHAVARLVALGDSRAQAERRLRRTLPRWLATTAGYVRIDGSSPPRRDLDAYVDHLLRISPIGTPSEVAAALTDAGASRLLLMVEGFGDRQATLEQIDALAAEVLPLL